MSRSEGNKINGKVSYPDLNMTQYPDKIDSRNLADAGYNQNMRGFQNRKDYNLAEHVNSLGDAVMALERALGTTPYVTASGTNLTTVSARINAIEGIDYDPRYGGVGWNTTQTLVGHTHTGASGSPSKIRLDAEVRNKLPKINLDLTQDTGLTGADLSISKDISTKISDSLIDKLSVSQGGVIQKNLSVKGKMNSRFYLDLDVTDMLSGGGTLITDNSTRSGRAVRMANKTEDYPFLRHENKELEYGKYVACVRVKTSNATRNENLFRIESFNQDDQGQWVLRSAKNIKSNDFAAVNTWQTFYLVFDHYSNRMENALRFNLVRMTTGTSYNLTFDYAHICPAHPAVYDL